MCDILVQPESQSQIRVLRPRGSFVNSRAVLENLSTGSEFCDIVFCRVTESQTSNDDVSQQKLAFLWRLLPWPCNVSGMIYERLRRESGAGEMGYLLGLRCRWVWISSIFFNILLNNRQHIAKESLLSFKILNSRHNITKEDLGFFNTLNITPNTANKQKWRQQTVATMIK